MRRKIILFTLLCLNATLFTGCIAQDGIKNDQENVSKQDPQLAQKYIQPDLETIQATLTAIQYSVTQEDGTEIPFENEYWDNKESGIYVDILT